MESKVNENIEARKFLKGYILSKRKKYVQPPRIRIRDFSYTGGEMTARVKVVQPHADYYGSRGQVTHKSYNCTFKKMPFGNGGYVWVGREEEIINENDWPS